MNWKAETEVVISSDGTFSWWRLVTEEPAKRFWNAKSGRLVAIELGAGLALPRGRAECEMQPGTLIRVNPAEAKVPRGGISLPVGALTALLAIDEELERLTR